ncbi:carbohydrate kinase family protein, partial [Streptomyces sp. NPDC058953]|uniref:carbohydrate kinase family protein n=1 Tax=Streptomyces sp. NPDC058953 TaxID=3346676 RepID=UPI0036BF3A7C
MIDSVPPSDRLTDWQSALRRAADSTRVLVIGSLNVDLIVHSDHEPEDDGAVVARSVTTAPGGHAGNCASALAALGMRVGVVAGVGTDAEGDGVLADLRARGVDVSSVQRHPDAPTGQVIIPVFRDKHYMLMHRGANDLLSAAAVRDALAAPVDAVVLFDPSREALRETVAAVGDHPGRPLLCWCPGGVYCADDIAATVAPRCDILLLNRDEHYRISRSAGEDAIGRPSCDVVTTLGAEGAHLRRGDRDWRVPAEPAGGAYGRAGRSREVEGATGALHLGHV